MVFGSTESTSETPFAKWVAKVKRDVLTHRSIEVWWYYSKTDVRARLEDNELLLSDHSDHIEIGSVIEFANVKHGVRDAGEADWFSRRYYIAGQGKIWERLESNE